MYRTIIVLALIAVALSNASTSFQKVNPAAVFTAQEQTGFTYSYPEGKRPSNLYYIPPDNGGNWGDNILYLQDGVLALTELRINYLKSSTDQSYIWTYNGTRPITGVFAINLGRQRGYISEIKMPPSLTSCQATLQVRGNQQVRVMFGVNVRN